MTKQGGWPDSGFGRRLKEVRESAGLSQQQLADKAACRSETVSRLERGEQEPAWPLVIALAAALGVDCTSFLDPSVKPPAEEPARPRGRPRKDAGQAEEKPAAKKGKKRKGE
jgi:transcriptional regulator with XRE-family HTH domain